MTQESENKQRRVDDKRADVPLQWNDAANANAAPAAAEKSAQREIPEFTGLDTIARVFAEAANGDGKVVLSAQSCDLLYRAMTTPIVAPSVQAQAELTDERIGQLWLSVFRIEHAANRQIAFARAIEREVRSAAREQARNEALEEAERAVLALAVHIKDFPECTGEQEAYNEALESSIAAIRDVRNQAWTCTVPPAGWACTRAVGHDGPCAAIPAASKEGDNRE